MKPAMLILLMFFIHDDVNRIAMINRLKKEAEKAYMANDFQQAAGIYRVLTDSLGQHDEEILMNLSHCYFNLKDTSGAYSQYRQLSASEKPKYRSVAFQQLGILNTNSGRYEEAEENFREALRADPSNEDARFNYELLKKLMKNGEQQSRNQQQDQKEQKDQQQKKDQQQEQQGKSSEEQNKEQQRQEQNAGEDEKKSQSQEEQASNESTGKKEGDPDRQASQDEELRKISAEKAMMILEAMKNAEEQYLQQLRRKPTRRPESGKPDW
jgi:tetratricopeptide (TPR) repeat protein